MKKSRNTHKICLTGATIELTLDNLSEALTILIETLERNPSAPDDDLSSLGEDQLDICRAMLNALTSVQQQLPPLRQAHDCLLYLAGQVNDLSLPDKPKKEDDLPII